MSDSAEPLEIQDSLLSLMLTSTIEQSQRNAPSSSTIPRLPFCFRALEASGSLIMKMSCSTQVVLVVFCGP